MIPTPCILPSRGTQGSVVLKKKKKKSPGAFLIHIFMVLSHWHRRTFIPLQWFHLTHLLGDYYVSQVLVKSVDFICCLSRYRLMTYPCERSLWWIVESVDQSVQKPIRKVCSFRRDHLTRLPGILHECYREVFKESKNCITYWHD